MMGEDVYRQLCVTMANRGGMYPGLDIPEFYPLARELFTEEEAAVCNALPRGLNPASVIAKEMGRDEKEVASLLETMADKGLCVAGKKGDITVYAGLPFVPGVFEYQFMRGTATERDRSLARLIRAYKEAYNDRVGPKRDTFPTGRVITVDRTVKAGNRVHTYDQVSAYIEKYEPLSVTTCYCRHQARLIDEKEHCGRPDEVCLQLGVGAQFAIDRRMGRRITKEEALEILKKTEEAGLVHCATNRQEIEFICSCCSCHCMFLKNALTQPRPGLAINSGFQPVWDRGLCIACETCIERCPMEALKMGEEDVPELDLDRCIGCGVCATGCASEAIGMEERPGIPVPPVDNKALKEAIKASQAGK